MDRSRSLSTFFVATAMGVLGGGALILTSVLTTRGQAMFLPYGGLIAAIALYLHSRRIRSFGSRFGASLLAFMIGTIILMTYIITVSNPAALHTPIGHKAWPLLIFLLIGSIVSAIVAKVVPSREGA